MKAKELAGKLMENPDLEVGLRKFGGNNRWPVNSVSVEEWDDTCDSIDLVKDTKVGGPFILVDAVEGALT